MTPDPTPSALADEPSTLDFSRPDDCLRWALVALELVQNKLISIGSKEDSTEMHNLHAGIASVNDARAALRKAGPGAEPYVPFVDSSADTNIAQDADAFGLITLRWAECTGGHLSVEYMHALLSMLCFCEVEPKDADEEARKAIAAPPQVAPPAERRQGERRSGGLFTTECMECPSGDCSDCPRKFGAAPKPRSTDQRKADRRQPPSEARTEQGERLERFRNLLRIGRAEDINADDIEWLCDQVDVVSVLLSVYESAVKGRQEMRTALRTARAEGHSAGFAECREAAATLIRNEIERNRRWDTENKLQQANGALVTMEQVIRALRPAKG